MSTHQALQPPSSKGAAWSTRFLITLSYFLPYDFLSAPLPRTTLRDESINAAPECEDELVCTSPKMHYGCTKVSFDGYIRCTGILGRVSPMAVPHRPTTRHLKVWGPPRANDSRSWERVSAVLPTSNGALQVDVVSSCHHSSRRDRWCGGHASSLFVVQAGA